MNRRPNQNELNLVKEIRRWGHKPFNTFEQMMRIKNLMEIELKEGYPIDLLFLSRKLGPMVSAQFKKPLRNYFELRFTQIQHLKGVHKIDSQTEIMRVITEYEEKLATEKLKSIHLFILEIQKWEEIFQDLIRLQEMWLEIKLGVERNKNKELGTLIYKAGISFSELEEDILHRK